MSVLNRLLPPKRVTIDVRLNARLQPMHRGSRFEDPLWGRLEQQHPQFEVIDAGTRMVEGRFTGCDFAFDVPRRELPAALEVLSRTLVESGCPRGSEIAVSGRPGSRATRTPVGTNAGLVARIDGLVTIDGAGDDGVLRSDELDGLIAAITVAAGADVVWSWRIHEQDSEIYLYGPDADALTLAVTTVLDATAHADSYAIHQFA